MIQAIFTLAQKELLLLIMAIELLQDALYAIAGSNSGMKIAVLQTDLEPTA